MGAVVSQCHTAGNWVGGQSSFSYYSAHVHMCYRRKERLKHWETTDVIDALVVKKVLHKGTLQVSGSPTPDILDYNSYQPRKQHLQGSY